MSDLAFQGFCLYGLVCALFVRAVELLVAPTEESMTLALTGVRVALGLLGPVSELSFLENSCWPFSWLELRLLEEGLVKALSTPEMEPHWRRPLEGPPRMESEVDLHIVMAMALPEHPAVVFLDTVEAQARHHLQQVLGPNLRVVGLGDHATATLDAGLMVKRGVTEAVPTTRVEITMSGLACPESQAGRHHCRLKCQVLGECRATNDALAEWIGKYVFGAATRRDSLGDNAWWDAEAADKEPIAALIQALRTLSPLREGDLVVCAHPTSLCLMSFWATWRFADELAVRRLPMLLHISSTLLYGAPGGAQGALGFLRLARDLLTGPFPLMALAEGPFLSAQLFDQVGVRLASCPALALYLEDTDTGYLKHKASERLPTVLVTRARLFNHPAGFFFRGLLMEFAIINQPMADAKRGHFWFSEVPSLDEKADEVRDIGFGGGGDPWKSWEEMARCAAAFFVPSDIHQRTFIELYRMNVPTFMPAVEWLLRLPLAAPFGAFSYAGALSQEEKGSENHRIYPTSFNAESESPRTLHHWYFYSDYAHFPHIGRCNSIPDLLHQISVADLDDVALKMKNHSDLLAKGVEC
ncbi:GIP [Symbiodinium sp. CCMP2456]|nr:GIP [Symbiodinium sp. CCMP2456]